MNDLVLLGDSHLSGSSEDAGVVLVARFRQDFPDIRIINLAQGGVDTDYGLDVVTKTELPINFIALVLFGSNDAAPWKQVSLEKFVENYRQILTALKAKKALKIVVFSPPPVNPQKQSPPGRSNSELIKYAQAVETVAAEFQVKFIDLFNLLTQAMKNSDIHYSDGVHLNSVGYDIFYNQIKLILID